MPECNGIKFVGHPDPETFLALSRIVRPQKAWSTSGRILIGLTVLAAIGSLILIGVSPLLAILTAIPMFFLVGVFSLLPTFARKLMDRKLTRTYFAAMQKLRRTGIISPAGIQIRLDDGRTELAWSYFDRTLVIKDAIGLCKDRELVDAISRSMFATVQEWNSAGKIVLENVPKSN